MSGNNTKEFIADAFGTATEHFANEPAPFDTPDFLMFETANFNGTGAARNMFNPAALGAPNCYSNSIPGMPVHAAAGPGNHWFYLLSQGSTGTPGPASPTCDGSVIFNGIGVKDSIRILYNAMLMKTTASSYLRYRVWTLQAAINLFPGSCTAYKAVLAAWNAVSVPNQTDEPTCTGGEGLLFYHQQNGGAATGSVNPNGTYTPSGQTVGFSPGWTHITPIDDRRVLFYRATEGVIAIGSINPNGTYTHAKTFDFFAGITHIIPVGDGKVMFYRATDGAVRTGSVNSFGTYTHLQALAFAPGWTHITPDGDGKVLLYHATGGGVATGIITPNGTYTHLQTLAFAPGWTHITPVGVL
jgi:hypothetical protein